MDTRIFVELEERLLAPFLHVPVEWTHPRNVARIGLELFGLLRELHGLDEDAERLLYAASIVHDVGWVGGQQQHHKRSMEMILATDFAGVNEAEKRRIACLARYHRRAFPDPDHAVYGELSPGEQETVRRLAAILRVADGLDRGQVGAVESVSLASLADEVVHIVAHSSGSCSEELYGARRKSDLFRTVFGRSLVVSRAPRQIDEATADMSLGE